jgi:hypothetical protein
VEKILRSSFTLKVNVDLLAKTELRWPNLFVPHAQFFVNALSTP